MTSQNLTYKWLGGILIGIILALVAYISNTIIVDVNKLKSEHIEGNAKIQILESDNTDIQRRLQRIENKIDDIIDKSRQL